MNTHRTSKHSRATGDRWQSFWVVSLLVGLLVVLTVYYDSEALDTSLLPRLRGLYAALAAAVFILVLPPTARRLDLSVLRDPLVLCYGVFAFVCFGTLAFALNPTAGFTDAFKTFGAFLFLCLLCLLLPTIPHWPKRLFQVIACGALVSAAWGIYEMLTILGPGLHPRERMEAVQGTMANVNLYAGFLALVFPLCLGATATLGGWWRVVACLSTTATVTMLVLLQSRAAYLGLAASLAVGLAGALLFAPSLGISPRVRRVLAVAGAVLVVCLLGFYFLAPETNPFAARLRSMASGLQERSLANRLMAWEITVRMIADHFPWGVGTGNFTMRLDEYFNEREGFHGDNKNWIYPHNDYLWVFAEEGVLGIVSYLGIFFIAFYHCIACLRSASSRWNSRLSLAVIMALAAYLVDSAFGFPLARVSHQVYLAAAFAAAVLLARESRAGLSTGVSPAPVARAYPRRLLVGALPALLILVLGFSYCRAAIKQELYLSVVFALEAEKMWPAALRVIRGAASPWKTTDVFATPWAYHEARILKQIGTKEETLEALERAYAQNPNRMHVINDLGSYYAMTGQMTKAIELLRKTVKRYPDVLSCAENLAQCYIDQDDYASALQVLENIPEDKRTDSIRRKIDGCRQMLNGVADEQAAPADKP